MVTSNHVHLLVKDTDQNVIATAIETDEHLHRCLVYMDLNMVRAGVITHPADWPHSGYREIQNPPKRYGIVDVRQLSALCGFTEVADFQRAHRDWVDEALKREMVVRERRWSERSRSVL
jgi:hypothetical protein